MSHRLANALKLLGHKLGILEAAPLNDHKCWEIIRAVSAVLRPESVGFRVAFLSEHCRYGDFQ